MQQDQKQNQSSSQENILPGSDIIDGAGNQDQLDKLKDNAEMEGGKPPEKQQGTSPGTGDEQLNALKEKEQLN